eukprot:Clim_evm17s231 gene=Clim_evmTU17s231
MTASVEIYARHIPSRAVLKAQAMALDTVGSAKKLLSKEYGINEEQKWIVKGKEVASTCPLYSVATDGKVECFVISKDQEVVVGKAKEPVKAAEVETSSQPARTPQQYCRTPQPTAYPALPAPFPGFDGQWVVCHYNGLPYAVPAQCLPAAGAGASGYFTKEAHSGVFGTSQNTQGREPETNVEGPIEVEEVEENNDENVDEDEGRFRLQALVEDNGQDMGIAERHNHSLVWTLVKALVMVFVMAQHGNWARVAAVALLGLGIYLMQQAMYEYYLDPMRRRQQEREAQERKEREEARRRQAAEEEQRRQEGNQPPSDEQQREETVTERAQPRDSSEREGGEDDASAEDSANGTAEAQRQGQDGSEQSEQPQEPQRLGVVKATVLLVRDFFVSIVPDDPYRNQAQLLAAMGAAGGQMA